MQENQPDAAKHTPGGIFFLEKCKKVLFIEEKRGQMCVLLCRDPNKQQHLVTMNHKSLHIRKIPIICNQGMLFCRSIREMLIFYLLFSFFYIFEIFSPGLSSEARERETISCMYAKLYHFHFQAITLSVPSLYI